MARPLIFDFSYPFWTDKEEYQELYGNLKPKFEELFLKHFYNERLCYPLEEYDDWNMELDGVLNLIMPYYNHLLESETWFDRYITNPAENTDYKEEYTKKIETEQTGKTNTQSATSTLGKGKTKTETDYDNVSDGATETSGKEKSSSTSESNTKAESGNISTSKANDLPKSKLDTDFDYASAIDTTDVKAVSESVNESESGTKSTSSASSETKTTNKTLGKDETDTESESTTEGESNSKSKSEGQQEEKYTFHRVGNIGVQTPGEVFEKSRLAFINTTERIFNDGNVTELFMHVY